MSVDYSWLDVSIASQFTREFGPKIKAAGYFDRVAASLTRLYVLPRNVPIFVRECDVYNAWYSSDAHSVAMCINYAEDIFKRLSPEAAAAPGIRRK